MKSATAIVPTRATAEGLRPLLRSLAAQTVEHQVIVVDNGSGIPANAIAQDVPHLELIRLEANMGFSRAVNIGVARAEGEVIVLVNDDCVCDPEFVQTLTAAIDPASDVVMAAGVMRERGDPGRIDTAGIEVDRTLLAFDYLNGEPLSVLDDGVPDPIGPSGAAAAFDRAAFEHAGGFDERIFAYLEDVDLALRLRRGGGSCALAPTARGTHDHSATLGSGSARKNYLMGYGRGYLLRKWSVLTLRRLPSVLLRDIAICIGQAVIDRNLAGLRGRVRGYLADVAPEPYPAKLVGERSRGAAATMRRRWRRRRRHRGPARSAGRGTLSAAGPRSLVVFHLAETSGPSRSLRWPVEWLGELGPVEIAVPGDGAVARAYAGVAEVNRLAYGAWTLPRGPLSLGRMALGMVRDVLAFRRVIRGRRPDVVVVATTMVPAALLAARLEGVPAIVYAQEIYDKGYGARWPRLAGGRAIARLTSRLSHAVIACSRTVADQFDSAGGAPVIVQYPAIAAEYAEGDGSRFRAGHRIPESAPLVGAVGNLTHGRGQDLLLEAVAVARRSLPELRCVIAGDPFPRARDRRFGESLVRSADRLGVGDSVEFAGYLDDVADLYAAADVLVNPARFNEPFGRVAFEAALAGCPVVATRVGAIPELLRDGESALLVRPGDHRALADAIERVVRDPRLGARLARGAREVAQRELEPGHWKESFRGAVESALQVQSAASTDSAVQRPAR